MTVAVNVVVNGEAATVEGSSTVASLLRDRGIDSRGTAVAVNGEVALRRRWEETVLRDGDRVEVLTAAQGG